MQDRETISTSYIKQADGESSDRQSSDETSACAKSARDVTDTLRAQ